MNDYVTVSQGERLHPERVYEVREDAHGDTWALVWFSNEERFSWELVELVQTRHATVASAIDGRRRSRTHPDRRRSDRSRGLDPVFGPADAGLCGPWSPPHADDVRPDGIRPVQVTGQSVSDSSAWSWSRLPGGLATRKALEN